MNCLQEDCRNWTGDGCACALLDLEPDDARDDFDYTTADLHPRHPDRPGRRGSR